MVIRSLPLVLYSAEFLLTYETLASAQRLSHVIGCLTLSHVIGLFCCTHGFVDNFTCVRLSHLRFLHVLLVLQILLEDAFANKIKALRAKRKKRDLGLALDSANVYCSKRI